MASSKNKHLHTMDQLPVLRTVGRWFGALVNTNGNLVHHEVRTKLIPAEEAEAMAIQMKCLPAEVLCSVQWYQSQRQLVPTLPPLTQARLYRMGPGIDGVIGSEIYRGVSNHRNCHVLDFKPILIEEEVVGTASRDPVMAIALRNAKKLSPLLLDIYYAPSEAQIRRILLNHWTAVETVELAAAAAAGEVPPQRQDLATINAHTADFNVDAATVEGMTKTQLVDFTRTLVDHQHVLVEGMHLMANGMASVSEKIHEGTRLIGDNTAEQVKIANWLGDAFDTLKGFHQNQLVLRNAIFVPRVPKPETPIRHRPIAPETIDLAPVETPLRQRRPLLKEDLPAATPVQTPLGSRPRRTCNPSAKKLEADETARLLRSSKKPAKKRDIVDSETPSKKRQGMPKDDNKENEDN